MTHFPCSALAAVVIALAASVNLSAAGVTAAETGPFRFVTMNLVVP